jgi:eukaryotic-like serine/threonine-protein kinase
MALMAGSRLGPYEIIAPLGAGGMGEVYRALDTDLGRQVAIKILPDTFAQDPERLARFEREAKTLAALNHPHIAAIYGLERSDGQTALVMELVEGPTLADRIADGRIPVDEALAIAKQMAEALETAHEQGIIHRDLKPANIKVRPDGTVKVLDFGLAKAFDPTASSSLGLTQSPTLSLQATYAGLILGTAAYMSPEQAAAKAVDKRADIWSFGVVVWEMLTGKPLFAGETMSHTLADVLRTPIDFDLLPANMPSAIRDLLRRCLDRDVKRRLRDIGEARIGIERAIAEPEPRGPALLSDKSKLEFGWQRALPLVSTALVVAAITSAGWSYIRPSPLSLIVTRFSFALPTDQTFSGGGRSVVAISPDGSQIAYVANRRIYLRAMSDSEAQPIPVVDDGLGPLNPVFSPDGRSIAFWSAGDQTLKKVSVTGGAPVTLAQIGPVFGMDWESDWIIAGQGGRGIVRVSANGGKPEVIVQLEGDDQAFGPQMLPDGQSLLFTLAKGSGAERWDKAQIVVQSLPSGKRTTLIDRGSDARYLATGHVVYALGGILFAMPFDARRLELSGGPVSIVEGVARGGATGTANFSVARNGSLAFASGPASIGPGLRELALIDRNGAAVAIKLGPANFEHPRVSPDGKQIVFSTEDDKEAVVWTYDISGAMAMRRLTFGGRNRFPIWSSDGQHVAFQSDREGDLGIFWQRTDGTGVERLTRADKDTSHVPESWSPNGEGFLFRVTKGSSNTVSMFSLKKKEATPFGGIQSVTATNAEFSPDGRWVAYSASAGDQSAAVAGALNGVFVQPFPATGAIFQVPRTEQQGGFRHQLWSRDGKEIFYMIGGAPVRFRVVEATTRPSFAFGNPATLSKPSFWLDSGGDQARQYDVLPDGQRFIIRVPAGSIGAFTNATRSAPRIEVVLNWTEELKQRVPTR